MYACLLISIFLYAVVAEKLFPSRPHPVDPVFRAALTIVALAVLGIAFSFRMRFLQPAAESLRTNPTDLQTLARWRGGMVVTATLCEAVALFGFALHAVGGARLESLAFYAVGAGFMILWWPQLP